MASNRNTWLWPILFGAVAPLVVVGIWGLLVAEALFPFNRYLWSEHQIKTAELSFSLSSVFEGVVGCLLGVAFGYALARLTRGGGIKTALLFCASFVLLPALLGGSESDVGMIKVLYSSPLMLLFAASTAVMLALAGRAGAKQRARDSASAS